MSRDLRVRDFQAPPGKRVLLKHWNPDATSGFKDADEAQPLLERDLRRLSALQERLFAEDRQSLLVVLQGMDTGGKDGTIKHVFTGVNPGGCTVTRFKTPSLEEAEHDFLWRVHRATPRRGEIMIFNRSHYEDVLIVRVRGLVPPAVWKRRYAQINRFERTLAESGTRILKFYLHIDKREQKRRLQARLADPTKRWKFSRTDLKERALWRDYRRAYEDALTECSTPWAPWHIVPANRKWHRNLVVARTIVETLEEMDPRLPKAPPGLSKIRVS